MSVLYRAASLLARICGGTVQAAERVAAETKLSEKWDAMS